MRGSNMHIGGYIHNVRPYYSQVGGIGSLNCSPPEGAGYTHHFSLQDLNRGPLMFNHPNAVGRKEGCCDT
jgi:hypothetical protein